MNVLFLRVRLNESVRRQKSMPRITRRFFPSHAYNENRLEFETNLNVTLKVHVYNCEVVRFVLTCVYTDVVIVVTIVQDGVISDMTRTVDKIVAASRLPLSIVIVGVGGADFTNMVSRSFAPGIAYT